MIVAQPVPEYGGTGAVFLGVADYRPGINCLLNLKGMGAVLCP